MKMKMKMEIMRRGDGDRADNNSNNYNYNIDGDLSEEMMIEILSRLAVKLILRFKCISKSWYVLPKNHNFISKHKNNYNNENTYLVYFYTNVYYPDNRKEICHYHFPDKELANTSSYEDYDHLVHDHEQVLDELGKVICYYEGLIFLYYKKRVIIWNYATEELRSVPGHYRLIKPKILGNRNPSDVEKNISNSFCWI